MSKENIKEISIIYIIDKEDEEYEDGKYINIFGLEFVKNNKDKFKMIIDNKEYEIIDTYNIENHNNNNELKIKLKGTNNVNDMSLCFIVAIHYHLYLIFQNGILLMLLI